MHRVCLRPLAYPVYWIWLEHKVMWIRFQSMRRHLSLAKTGRTRSKIQVSNRQHAWWHGRIQGMMCLSVISRGLSNEDLRLMATKNFPRARLVDQKQHSSKWSSSLSLLDCLLHQNTKSTIKMQQDATFAFQNHLLISICMKFMCTPSSKIIIMRS